MERIPIAPATLAALKDWLGVTIAAEDGQLTALLRAALELCTSFTGAPVDDWEAMPDALRHGAIRYAAHLYHSRESGEASAIPAAVAALWRPWRQVRLA